MSPAANPVIYLYPTWGVMPEKKHGEHAVHCTVEFSEAAGPIDVVHNLALPWGEHVPQPEWVPPYVVVNPLSGGPAAPLHVVKILDGDRIQIGRVKDGPGTAVLLDVWIFRPGRKNFLGL